MLFDSHCHPVLPAILEEKVQDRSLNTVVEGDGAVLPLGIVLGETRLHVRHDLRAHGLVRAQVHALADRARAETGGAIVSTAGRQAERARVTSYLLVADQKRPLPRG